MAAWMFFLLQLMTCDSWSGVARTMLEAPASSGEEHIASHIFVLPMQIEMPCVFGGPAWLATSRLHHLLHCAWDFRAVELGHGNDHGHGDDSQQGIACKGSRLLSQVVYVSVSTQSANAVILSHQPIHTSPRPRHPSYRSSDVNTFLSSLGEALIGSRQIS